MLKIDTHNNERIFEYFLNIILKNYLQT